jgi:hypothetical protein
MWLRTANLAGDTWERERPLRAALDRGQISLDEYNRRRWERDYTGLVVFDD